MTNRGRLARKDPSERKLLAALTRLVPTGALLFGVFWVLLGAQLGVRRSDSATTEATYSPAAFDHDHAAWTAILQRYLRDGRVDYAGLKQGGKSQLSAYLRTLESVSRDQYDAWTREQKLAFWINAYNANTVALIVEHYPIPSIRSIGRLPLAAFRKRFISMPEFRRRKLSLNEIENQILRKQFGEPRIHFAIVCASKGCPVLASEAYRAADLDQQLEEGARRFVRDPAKNRFDAASGTLYLSSIFKWFGGDFNRAAGGVPLFVARYAEEPTAAAIREENVRVAFLPYDWSLNQTEPPRSVAGAHLSETR
jgi:hypothetical protein